MPTVMLALVVSSHPSKPRLGTVGHCLTPLGCSPDIMLSVDPSQFSCTCN